MRKKVSEAPKLDVIKEEYTKRTRSESPASLEDERPKKKQIRKEDVRDENAMEE